MKGRKDRMQYLGFDDRWLIAIGIPGLGLLVLSIFCQFQFFELGNAFLPNFLEAVFYTTFYWFTLRWVIIALRKKYPDFRDSKKRVSYQVLFMLIFTPITGSLIALSIIWLQDNFQLPPTHKPNAGMGVFATYLVSFLMAAIYEAIYFYTQLKESVLEQEHAKQEHIRSQLEGLRNQVNPHFLFNSMNTLINIVREDQTLAIRFLENLSKVYRYILESRDEKLIPIERELEFIRAYVFLQEERFRGNLTVHIDIPPEQEQNLILPLSLQILFENVIKHNIISSKRPLTVWIYLDQAGKLVVRNNLQRKNQVLHSTKVGLDNIRTRYQFFTGESVDIEETDQFFTVRLPLLIPTAAL
ncbi:MAG: histidine kinase [Saprospiraceae bacterium]|nr:histidine kinase [Saprospiraceae bacterium]